jgi:hypothetical protein
MSRQLSAISFQPENKDFDTVSERNCDRTPCYGCQLTADSYSGNVAIRPSSPNGVLRLVSKFLGFFKEYGDPSAVTNGVFAAGEHVFRRIGRSAPSQTVFCGW